MYTEIAYPQPFDEGAPRLHTPREYGASPRVPFLYRLPCVGERPLAFTSTRLPQGLALDAETGVVSGRAQSDGEYDVEVTATNALGADTRPLRLVIRPDAVCRTPLLGFTTWNAFRGSVSQTDIADTATLLLATGLADYGYCYVNIDSGWQGQRRDGAVQPNDRFPDMRALVRDLHARGLKAGIYSTPMTRAWGDEFVPGCTDGAIDPRYPGAFYGIGVERQEEANARNFAAWCFDYLKYDWRPCDVDNADRMKRCLLTSGRDFAYCVTMNATMADAAYWRSHCTSWRDENDSENTWANVRTRFECDAWARYCRPGHFFDLDMLENNTVGEPDARLTPDEQLVSFSARALFPSPIQISTRLTDLTAFELAMLCNDEVLAVNQDALGIGAVSAAETVARGEDGALRVHTKVYRRPLENGDTAAGFFNLGEQEAALTLPLGGQYDARDLWAKRDMGIVSGTLTLRLPPHTVRLVRLAPRGGAAPTEAATDPRLDVMPSAVMDKSIAAAEEALAIEETDAVERALVNDEGGK